jgi:hypothetical protein
LSATFCLPQTELSSDIFKSFLPPPPCEPLEYSVKDSEFTSGLFGGSGRTMAHANDDNGIEEATDIAASLQNLVELLPSHHKVPHYEPYSLEESLESISPPWADDLDAFGKLVDSDEEKSANDEEDAFDIFFYMDEANKALGGGKKTVEADKALFCFNEEEDDGKENECPQQFFSCSSPASIENVGGDVAVGRKRSAVPTLSIPAIAEKRPCCEDDGEQPQEEAPAVVEAPLPPAALVGRIKVLSSFRANVGTTTNNCLADMTNTKQTKKTGVTERICSSTSNDGLTCANSPQQKTVPILPKCALPQPNAYESGASSTSFTLRRVRSMPLVCSS